MGSESVNIFLIEDDEADREAIERSFRKQQITNPIVTAPNGEIALKMLRGDGCDPLPRPFLILLDLNMPRMGGIEFLEALRGDPKIEDSIVFVLTTSDQDKDKVAAYSNHVAGYIVKSRAGTDFANVISLLEVYRRHVEFPPPKSSK